MAVVNAASVSPHSEPSPALSPTGPRGSGSLRREGPTISLTTSRGGSQMMVGPVLCGSHPLTWGLWGWVATISVATSHSGYVPLGAAAHDEHHMKFKCAWIPKGPAVAMQYAARARAQLARHQRACVRARA